MIYGTSYFVSKEAAIRYYTHYGYGNAQQTAEAVDRKIADGEIHIGKPALKDGQTLVMMDGGKRYGIEEGK